MRPQKERDRKQMIKAFSYARRLEVPESMEDVLWECSRASDVEGMRIEWKTTRPNGSVSTLGACRYRNGFLIPESGPPRSLSDEISGWEYRRDSAGRPSLTVWIDKPR